jgi:hypothetical protein
MKHSRLFTNLGVLVMSLGLAGSAHAQVAIDDSYSGVVSDGATSTISYPSFDAYGSDKLVVMIGARRDRNMDSSNHVPLGITSVTYGGAALIEATTLNQEILLWPMEANSFYDHVMAVYYLDDPGPAGNIVVQFDAKAWADQSGLAALALSGTADGVGPTSSLVGLSTSLDTLLDNTFVVAISRSGGYPVATPTPDSPLSDLSNDYLGAGYAVVSGSSILGFSGGSADADSVIVAAGFEPSCYAPSIEGDYHNITPSDAPISFTFTATGGCGESSVEVVSYDCFKFTQKGKLVDKTGSCAVDLDGDMITIFDSGGVGTTIEWTVVATDETGNVADESHEITVENPGKSIE